MMKSRLLNGAISGGKVKDINASTIKGCSAVRATIYNNPGRGSHPGSILRLMDQACNNCRIRSSRQHQGHNQDDQAHRHFPIASEFQWNISPQLRGCKDTGAENRLKWLSLAEMEAEHVAAYSPLDWFSIREHGDKAITNKLIYMPYITLAESDQPLAGRDSLFISFNRPEGSTCLTRSTS